MVSRGTSLARSEFVELDTHFIEKVVVVRRTGAHFARIADIDCAVDVLVGALPSERRKGYSVLVDMRIAPVRTDPSLEPAFARYRVEVERGFERVVVVVATVVGRIRSDRLGQVTQIPLNIVASPDEAWTILCGT